MRGLINTALFSAPTVVVYVDDAPYSSSMATMGNLFVIDDVDVYRSSQPARFGKNAYAGAIIDIKTKQPENDLHTGVALESGDFNHYQVTANSSGALLKDQLYFNLSGQYQQRDDSFFVSPKLGVNVTLSDNALMYAVDDYRDSIGKVNYAGKLAPFVPELTGLLALQYKHPRGYFARAEGVDRQNFF